MAAVGLDEYVGRVLGDRYRLVSPVGAGASARVYLAMDTTLRRQVAVKLLHRALASDPKFRKRFRAEAHSSAQLSHPNIMAVFDWNEQAAPKDAQAAPAYLVTELLTGGSLRSMLDAGHRLTLSQALLVGLHAAEGLAYAHDRGIVHRDIKPANLLFGAEGRLRIADFGIARAVAEAAWTEPEGSLVGTARYAAPEQADGRAVDGRADCYGLALTIIEAVTGEVPLTGATPLGTMVMRQDQDVPVPDALGPLVPALRAAGRSDSSERSTAGQLAAGLRAAASLLPRPTELPLVGLTLAGDGDSIDPDDGQGPAEELTTVLVLDDETVTLDLADSSVEPIEAEEIIDHWTPPDPDLDLVDEDDEFEELPDEARRWPVLLLVLALVGGAAFVFLNRDGQTADNGESAEQTVTHPVGTYVGRAFGDVTNEIEQNNWTVFTSDGRADGSEAGEVIQQSPAPGEELAEGLEITLVVSEGQQIRVVPTLEGLPLTEALAALETNGLFLGRTAEVHDENVPEGTIISASIEPGIEVETGTEVELTWSLGPAPRLVPELNGFDLAAAQALLTELGLTFVVTEDYSLEVAEGDVIGTDPPLGTELDRGGEVTLVVSLGLPFADIPNVVGMTAAEAADVLTEAGFDVIDTVGPPNAEVLATDPPAGESRRLGTEIIIFTRR